MSRRTRQAVQMQFARRSLFLILVLWAAGARAQPAAATAWQDDEPRRVSVEGAAGALLNGGGFNLSGSIGYLLTRRITAHAAAEIVHLPTEVNFDDRGCGGVLRGGTMRLLSGDVRVAFATSQRVSPYALAGAGFGTSRPNVNQYFPDAVTNNMRLAFAGIGVRFQVNPRVSVAADTRFAIETERGEAMLLLPLRAGVAWRF